MLVQNIVTGICLALLIGEAAYVIVGFATKKGREGRITFLRNFKKGKCLAVYLTAIPLVCIGVLFSGKKFISALIVSLAKCIDFIVLKFDISVVQALVDANLFYALTVYFCFILVIINAALFTLSMFSQLIWQGVQAKRARGKKGDKLFVYGCNAGSVSVYNSSKSDKKFIVDSEIKDGEKSKLYARKVAYTTRGYNGSIDSLFACMEKNDKRLEKLKQKYGKKIEKLCIGSKNSDKNKRAEARARIVKLKEKYEEKRIELFENGAKFDVVVNTENEEKNLEICRRFILKIKDSAPSAQNYIFDKLRVYVFGDPRYEAIYEDVTSSSFGCVRYVNKYRMIAMNFIERYPLTSFMDGRHIDYKTSYIKNGVDINVCMIGFGKTGRQIFLTSVANNQFIEKGVDGYPRLKQVRYRIFDKDPVENNKSLNHNYYRYKNELKTMEKKRSDYLPLPDLPAVEEYKQLDVNDKRFYKNVREGFSDSPRAANFAVIAFGTDLENLDMAQKLIEKKREWKLKNLTVFVKTRTEHGEQEHLRRAGCRFIGNEQEYVYNVDEIIGDEIFRMARRRNEIYCLENKVASKPEIVQDAKLLKENAAEAKKKWYVRSTQTERESSLYCCLSLKSKLNLMGLDYVKKEERGRPLSEEEYLSVYAENDNIEYCDTAAGGKKIVKYTLDFKPSRRRDLAVHEHLRWNSYMISKGVVPSSIEEILTEQRYENGKPKYDTKTKRPMYSNGKNYRMRRHGNLTTFDGLVDFRKMIAKRDGCNEADKDVIKYDYQLLDDACWLLEAGGFKIIKLKKTARMKGSRTVFKNLGKIKLR